MNMSKLCPNLVEAPLLSSTALIILGMEFTIAAQVVAGFLFHSHTDITELLNVRHMVLLHLPLEDAPNVLDRVQVWRQTWPLHHLQQQGSCHLGGVFAGGYVMLKNSF